MNSFFQGILHITDLQGYDHMLFILALCAPYVWQDWKKIILMATAFTLGHSITLVLAALDLIRFSSDLIETLIPITIFITAAFNLWALNRNVNPSMAWKYTMTAGFGLIHGMGFSSYFRMMFNETSEMIANLVWFNLGVEAGQIIIIAAIMLIISGMLLLGLSRAAVAKILSIIALVISAWLIWDKTMGA